MCGNSDLVDAPATTLGPHSVLSHVVDVHCHPTDSHIPKESVEKLSITICAMATRSADQSLVRELAVACPTKVIPCFGYHPWFSHWIALTPPSSKESHYRALFADAGKHSEVFERLLVLLPEPTLLDEIIFHLRRDLEAFPQAMLGEVGLDRASRVPLDYSAARRELTPFTVPLAHQMAILESQIKLAVQLGRNISMHSVKAQKVTVDLLDRMQAEHGEQWTNISLDLHSCGFSPESWIDVEKRHPNIFLSLSTAINGRSPNHRALIAACSPHRILVESDIHEIEQCTPRVWDMVSTIADIKGWQVETTWEDDFDETRWGAVHHLEHNWKLFQSGHHSIPRKKKSRRQALPFDAADEE